MLELLLQLLLVGLFAVLAWFYGFDVPPTVKLSTRVPPASYGSTRDEVPSQTAAGAPTTLRFVSWNVWCIPCFGTGNPTDGAAPSLFERLTGQFGRNGGLLTRALAPPLVDKKPHARNAAKFLLDAIAKAEPQVDFLLLQEAWWAPTPDVNDFQRSMLPRDALVEALRGEFPYYTPVMGCGKNVYWPFVDIPPMDSGLLIMSKWPFEAEDVHFEQYRNVVGNEAFAGKGILAVTMRLGSPQARILVACTHLQANEGNDIPMTTAAQNEQARQAIDFLKKNQLDAVVLGGDFNPIEVTRLAHIGAAMKAGLQSKVSTLPLKPTTNERHILQAQLDAFYVTHMSTGSTTCDCEVIENSEDSNGFDSTNPSDHKPLLCTVNFAE